MANWPVSAGGEAFVVYRNSALGITMKYPASWQRQERADPSSFLVAFLAPPEAASQFRENVNFMVHALLTPMKLEDYFQYGLQRVRQGPFDVGASAPCSLSAMPAYRVTYTGPLNPMLPLPGKCLSIYAVKGQRAYGLSYTSRAEKYDYFLPTVEEMVRSISIQ